jgi:hypothetical protein
VCVCRERERSPGYDKFRLAMISLNSVRDLERRGLNIFSSPTVEEVLPVHAYICIYVYIYGENVCVCVCVCVCLEREIERLGKCKFSLSLPFSWSSYID